MTEKDLVLDIRLQPSAKADEISGWMEDGTLKVKVRNKPVEGQANEGLIHLLSKTLGVPKGNIAIVAGEKSRNKRVRILGITRQDLENHLSNLQNQDP